jgi:hypothetical protein
MSKGILEKIKSQGYWRVVIRPTQFVQDRIPTLAECERLIEYNQVKYRGWYFPHLESEHPGRFRDYIEVGTEFRSYVKEIWRFYQSGQFVFFSGLIEDWIGDAKEMGFQPGTGLAVKSTLYRLTEVYEFAARLAEQGVLGDRLLVAADLVGTRGRRLFSWKAAESFEWGLERAYECNVSDLPHQTIFGTKDLIARSRERSRQHFMWIVERFGYELPEAMVRREQERFFEGRF